MLDKTLPQQTVSYLRQVLGEGAVRMAPARAAAQLPYFIQEAYGLLTGTLLGRPLTIAFVKGREFLSAQQISQHTKQIGELFQTPVIVALPAIAPGERKQLIQHGVAFLVPGRQLFAPSMGMILSERYGTEPQRAVEIASPATQALLIWFLNQHPVSETWHPFEAAATLGYAGMTATRAVRELMQFELFELEERGRAKYLKLTDSRHSLWEKAKPFLRTPVIKTLWTYDRGILDLAGARFAGESALARLSMLNEPQQPAIAITSEAAQQSREDGIFFEPRQLADAIAVQVWRYIPNMLVKEKIVDPLSLWLSLQHNPDDRIQMALDDIEENFRW